MDISDATAEIGSAVQVAMQRLMLDAMKTQGADVISMIANASAPAGSVNSPTQGRFIDAHA